MGILDNLFKYLVKFFTEFSDVKLAIFLTLIFLVLGLVLFPFKIEGDLEPRIYGTLKTNLTEKWSRLNGTYVYLVIFEINFFNETNILSSDNLLEIFGLNESMKKYLVFSNATAFAFHISYSVANNKDCLWIEEHIFNETKTMCIGYDFSDDDEYPTFFLSPLLKNYAGDMVAEYKFQYQNKTISYSGNLSRATQLTFRDRELLIIILPAIIAIVDEKTGVPFAQTIFAGQLKTESYLVDTSDDELRELLFSGDGSINLLYESLGIYMNPVRR